jgi:hypothetical protein
MNKIYWKQPLRKIYIKQFVDIINTVAVSPP